jgi:hypothetical protein
MKGLFDEAILLALEKCLGNGKDEMKDSTILRRHDLGPLPPFILFNWEGSTFVRRYRCPVWYSLKYFTRSKSAKTVQHKKAAKSSYGEAGEGS